MFIFVLLLLLFYYFIRYAQDDVELQPPKNFYVTLNNLAYRNSKFIQDMKNWMFSYKDQASIKPFDFYIFFEDNHVHFSFYKNNDKLCGRIPLPPNYIWSNGKVVEANSCLGKSSGFTRGTANEINDYIFENKPIYGGIDHVELPPQSNIPAFIQSSLPFYFSCLDDKIDKMYMCPDYYDLNSDNVCEFQDVCRGRPNGYAFSAFGLLPTQYYICEGERAQLHNCEYNQVFQINKCVYQDQCTDQPNGTTFPLTNFEYIYCEDEESVPSQCNPGTFFHNGHCVDNTCMDKQDGETIKKKKVEDGLQFFSHYITCRNKIVESVVMCGEYINDSPISFNKTVLNPATWECDKPHPCTHILPSQDQLISTTLLQDQLTSKFSEIMDTLYGFACINYADTPPEEPGNQSVQQLRIVPVGHLLIDNTLVQPLDSKVPILNVGESYYNTTTKTIEHCNPNKYFNIVKRECQPKFDNQHPSVTLSVPDILLDDTILYEYTFESVREASKLRCRTREGQILNPIYNICIHKACVNLPFLKQFKDLKIFTDETHYCTYDGKSIVHMDYDYPFHSKLDFWNQAFTNEEIPPCISGEPVKSRDKILKFIAYKTCDVNQPFVFCPQYSQIQKHGDTYVCEPPQDSSELKILMPDQPHMVEIEGYEKFVTVPIDPTAPCSLKVNDMKQYVNYEVYMYQVQNADNPKVITFSDYENIKQIELHSKIKSLPSNLPNFYWNASKELVECPKEAPIYHENNCIAEKWLPYFKIVKTRLE